MIYGDNPQKINEREDKLGLKTYSYAPQISAIAQSGNLYVYCGNNPVFRADPSGDAWYHWAMVGGLVALAAVATVVTAGGATAALIAVTSVASGMAATTTASTIAAGALIGTSVVAGAALLSADYTSIRTFNSSANWGTVGVAFTGGLLGAAYGFRLSSGPSTQTVPKASAIAKRIVNADRVGTALSKNDLYHRACSYLSEAQLSNGTVSYITGGDGVQRILLQVEGELNGVKGVFEFILQLDGTVSHQLFTPS